jgi:catechol 2,3-dioxygenase-like lactoylglutathione lyase family enzyme
MEGLIADLVKRFESGKMDRREFCQTVALAATVYAAGEGANAETSSGFTVLGINHFSYTCPDYTKARDFFTSVFGLDVAKDTGQRANLTFGPEPGKGGTFMIARNPVNNNRPMPQAVIDHFCFTLSSWNEERVRAAIRAKGLELSGGRNGSLHVLDPNYHYDIQFANDVEENAFRHGI